MADDTVPMISLDGSIGDVPKARVGEAVKAGFKVGAELSKDGKSGIVPLDRVHDALGAGFTLAPSSASSVAGASVPRPAAPGLTDQAAAFGNGPITPQAGESFSQTMQRAAQAGGTVSEDQLVGQTIQGVRDTPAVLGSAAGAGVVGPAALAAGGIAAEASPGAGQILKAISGTGLKIAPIVYLADKLGLTPHMKKVGRFLLFDMGGH